MVNTLEAGSPLYAVPCHRRAAAVEGFSEAAERLLETQDGEAESWVAPENYLGAGPSGQPPEIPGIDDESAGLQAQQRAGPGAAEAGGHGEGMVQDIDDVPDIDDLTLAEEEDEVDKRQCCVPSVLECAV